MGAFDSPISPSCEQRLLFLLVATRPGTEISDREHALNVGCPASLGVSLAASSTNVFCADGLRARSNLLSQMLSSSLNSLRTENNVRRPGTRNACLCHPLSNFLSDTRMITQYCCCRLVSSTNHLRSLLLIDAAGCSTQHKVSRPGTSVKVEYGALLPLTTHNFRAVLSVDT